jgi:glutamate--cysteine ligase
VTDTSTSRIARLESSPELLSRTLRGIEKEGLRVDARGKLATTPHPDAFGRALTHPRITTDYSEALLELITGTHTRVDSMLEELDQTHRFVYGALGEELIWNASMPAMLPPSPDIPIAFYGSSNSGRLKHVYRRGLAERYGKAMQCIAGVHYNFSLDDRVWSLLDVPGDTDIERRSNGYMGLIRNFQRYSWLLMYLFGATPAVSRRFMADQPAVLQELDSDTLYAPYATSLRMSDLGYQNKAQAQLKLGYNRLEDFLGQLYTAVTQPWPVYEAIGTHRDGEWVQLNTHVLQIENEYYATIRPKRATGRCERPITAMNARGVQYVEVRCLDIDPDQPIGIHADTARFVDAFLLFCASEPSAPMPDGGYSPVSVRNFASVVKTGRQPGLMLEGERGPVSVPDWGQELLDRIAPYAALFDRSLTSGRQYADALAAQRGKLADPDTTPSARLLASLRESGASFHEHALAQSRAHAATLRSQPLAADTQAQYLQLTRKSVADEAELVAGDLISFDDYVARYESALVPPGQTVTSGQENPCDGLSAI